MATRPSPPRAKAAQAKLLYDAGAPLAEITKLLGMTDGQFRSFRERNDWPKRASACKRKADAEAPPPQTKTADPARLIARLEDAVEREFARAEAALDKHPPKTIEASARTLATLVKTLAELKRMQRENGETREDATAQDDDASDAPPRELAELRAELARRLERLRGGGPPG
ncbi:hypothetical protein [Methylocystis sp. Sn-Cys]|uniref:hypothetical protein n=1 Tax=Methylocystis sp. Sn-Cys TaxID=1701263 RepID=UPI001922D561|nr:hypothetical protein [Methylocystis sp. Sn-Cys]MBL1257456.1 hypothetical protein [Methylocystis sp. Sn-Cys]